MDAVIEQVLAALKTKLSELNFKNWIQPARLRIPAPAKLQIEVPNKFIRDWLTENYLGLIQYELFKVTGIEHQVFFEIVPDLSSSGQMAEAEALVPPPTIKSDPQTPSPFYSKYTFDNFVVGSSNQFVHAAAKAVGENPAKAYNPLFIYGGVGLGKTHLLSAIGHLIHQKNRQWRIIYITGEQFTNELISAIRSDKMFEFRKKFRDACDLFLVDDVQFIAGKERTQEEFFHTFNFLYEARRQIVLTSDSAPKDIPQLEERLRSRFEWGLIADIQAPDTETRVAILKKKAEEDKIDLPDDVAMYLATKIRSNIRELEGALIRIGAFASLVGAKQIGLEMVQDVLKNVLPEIAKRLTIEGIQQLVADHYQIKLAELTSSRRLKTLVLPRQIAMYLCRKHVKSSFPELGLKFGGKDHSTVVHAVQKMERQLEGDSELKREVHKLEQSLWV